MTRHSESVSDVFCDNVWSELSSQHTSLNGITESFRRRGRSVVKLLSLVFFAAYCQWHNIILAEWLHSTDIRAQSQFSDCDDIGWDQSKPISLMSVVSSLAWSLLGAMQRCTVAPLSGGRGLLWSGQGWQYISHHNGRTHLHLLPHYPVTIQLGPCINKWQVTPSNIGTGIKYWTIMWLFLDLGFFYAMVSDA